MREEDRKLVEDLFFSKIRPDQLTANISLKFSSDEDLVQSLLGEALREKDCELVEESLGVGFTYFGFGADIVPVLNDLLNETWHISHEDIASLLQEFRDPSSVEVLFETTQKEFDYLAHDDAFALGVKCMWALGDINNRQSKQKLKALSQSENQVIREGARFQLERIDQKKLNTSV